MVDEGKLVFRRGAEACLRRAGAGLREGLCWITLKLSYVCRWSRVEKETEQNFALMAHLCAKDDICSDRRGRHFRDTKCATYKNDSCPK